MSNDDRIARFWLLSERMTRGALRVEPVDDDIDGAALWYGRQVPQESLHFRTVEGNKHMDIVGSTALIPYLVSERFEDLLKTGGFTGWTTHACTIVGKHAPEAGAYRWLAITGRCGPIEVERSKLVPARTSDGVIPGQFDHLGVYFDVSTWDGTDIFLPEKGPSRPIVTTRLRNTIHSAKLSNVELVRADEKRTPLGYL